MLFNLTEIFGDFIVCRKEWLNFSGGTDKSDELYYNFSIAKRPFLDGHSYIPTQIPYCDFHS